MAGTGTGIDAQLGFGLEPSGYGSGQASDVSEFLEFTSESLKLTRGVYSSASLRAQRQVASVRRRIVTSRTVAGDVNLEFASRGMGQLLAAALGGHTADAADADGFTTHHFTLGETLPTLVIQKGVPMTSGVIRPYTFPGALINTLDLTMAVGSVLQAKLGVVARDSITSQPLQPATYHDDLSLFAFMGGSVVSNGQALGSISAAEFQLANELKTGRYFLGSGGLQAQPLIAALRKLSGKVEADFESTVLADAFDADTTISLVFDFTAPDGAELKITLPTVKLNGDAPEIKGPEVVTLSCSFDALQDGAQEPVTIDYKTLDATL